MRTLRITARLATPFIAIDDWSPSLDQILIWALLDCHGRLLSNPGPEWAQQNHNFILDNLPIALGKIDGNWYHQCSSPCYLYQPSGILETVKMWTQQDQHLDWGKSRRNWNVQGFCTKTWRHKEPLRESPRIDWYCTGDPDKIDKLLNGVLGLGKRRHGQIYKWEISDCEDWHLDRNGQLMRPIPTSLHQAPQQFIIKRWGWRSPVTNPENIDLCYMPSLTKSGQPYGPV